ncbi:MAG: methyltransferase domain-containing protein [Candidatus Tectomicrobia bacterium]|nr:methyltransferase domain-containing protein [Candidatus Tectomicrobia bacterium]
MYSYVHGYSTREGQRLFDQAFSVRDLIHHETWYPSRSWILEAGCGIGAQTVTLATQSPEAKFLSLDISFPSLVQAAALIRQEAISNVSFQQADLYRLPFHDEAFDHIFVCFVFEHLEQPLKALEQLKRVLKVGGTITVFEGDHGSCYFFPETESARRAWECLINVQAHLKGDSLMGRRLFPLLMEAGFQEVKVSPKMVYIDASKPALMESFVEKTIVPMVEGVREQAFALNLIDGASWEQGIHDLNTIAVSPSGTFCYTFFKGIGVKRS